MNSFAIVALFAVIAGANAGLLAPSANILQGPSSRTTLIGPEGSVISSVAPGGQVITDSAPGVVAYSAPVVAAPAPVVSAYSAPLVAGPVVAARAAPLAYSAPILAAASPLLAPAGINTVVAGPSGTIATSRGLTAAGYYGW